MALPVISQQAADPRKGPGGDRRVYANQVSQGVQAYKYASLRPKQQPYTLTITAGGVPVLPTAVAAQTDQVRLHDVNIEMNQITAQTLLPRLVSGSEDKGIEIALDQVNNETVEYVLGVNNIGCEYLYTVGTDVPVTLRVTLELTTNNGIDQMVIGWRKQQAYTVAGGFITAVDPVYTDFAALGFAAAVSSPNTIATVTNLSNSGASTITQTGATWASGKIHTLEVRIYGRKVFYLINGVPLGSPIGVDGLGVAQTVQTTVTPPVYNFTNALTLVPFIFIRQDAGLSTVFLSPKGVVPGVEVGPLFEMGLDPNNLLTT